MLFQYESVIDVGNVTEYTIKDLIPGKTYYLAATAYDENDNESAYSIELTHTVSFVTPAAPEVLIFKLPTPLNSHFIDSEGVHVIIQYGLSDPIKEIIEEK